MLLKDILGVKGSKVWTIRAHQTVREAVEILVRQKIGSLLVFGTGTEIVGILSERDVMQTCFQDGKSWESALVSKVMTKNVIIGTPEDQVEYIMGVMTQNRVRHIPVLDGKMLCGIVSIGDVVKALLKDSEYQNRYLKEYLYGS